MMPVDVLGELAVLNECGGEFRVAAQGAIISVELPSLSAGRKLAGQAAGRKTREATIQRLHKALRLGDLTLNVNVAGRQVASLTPDSQDSLLSRLLGVAPMELRPVGLLRVLLHV